MHNKLNHNNAKTTKCKHKAKPKVDPNSKNSNVPKVECVV